MKIDYIYLFMQQVKSQLQTHCLHVRLLQG